MKWIQWNFVTVSRTEKKPQPISTPQSKCFSCLNRTTHGNPTLDSDVRVLHFIRPDHLPAVITCVVYNCYVSFFERNIVQAPNIVVLRVMRTDVHRVHVRKSYRLYCMTIWQTAFFRESTWFYLTALKSNQKLSKICPLWVIFSGASLWLLIFFNIFLELPSSFCLMMPLLFLCSLRWEVACLPDCAFPSLPVFLCPFLPLMLSFHPLLILWFGQSLWVPTHY